VYEGPLARPQVDPAFGLQPVQGLAHRLPADAQLPGELGFHQVLAGPEGAGHDQLDQSLVHGLPQRHRPRDRPDRPRCRTLSVVSQRLGHAHRSSSSLRSVYSRLYPKCSNGPPSDR
jgi:hypothetical protein